MNTVSLPVGSMLPPNPAHRVKFPYLASSYINRQLEKLNADVLSNAQMLISLLERQKKRKKKSHHSIQIFGKMISRIIVIIMWK